MLQTKICFVGFGLGGRRKWTSGNIKVILGLLDKMLRSVHPHLCSAFISLLQASDMQIHTEAKPRHAECTGVSELPAARPMTPHDFSLFLMFKLISYIPICIPPAPFFKIAPIYSSNGLHISTLPSQDISLPWSSRIPEGALCASSIHPLLPHLPLQCLLW